jgi:geranylgeranyl diphosphate synthase type II
VASLIHDDLPCMDNAIKRRGKECLHLKFNEETAIISGDGLINLAYGFICDSNLNDINKLKAIKLLSKMTYDICLGQTLELQNNIKTYEDWIEIHKLKTGSLIACACGLGAICANAADDQIQEAIDFGYALGINYQIYDDIKDNDGLSCYDNSIIINKNNKIIYKYKNQLKEKIC